MSKANLSRTSSSLTRRRLIQVLKIKALQRKSSSKRLIHKTKIGKVAKMRITRRVEKA